MPNPHRQRRRIPVELLALAGMVLAFFGHVLLTDRIFLLDDLCYLFWPGYVFYRDSLLNGVLPLWNPYMTCGEPFFANIQRAVLYPPNLIYLLLPTVRATVAATCFHILLAGIGAYGLSRVWRVSSMGSLLAGVVYALNAYIITKIAYPSELGCAAWYPVVLAAFIVWLRRRDRRSLFLLSASLCVQFLSGFPEAVTFTVASLGLYAVLTGVHDWRAEGRWHRLATPLLGLALAGLLALLLCTCQLLPTWEAMQLCGRGKSVDPQLAVTSLHPLTLLCLLIPSLYGTYGCYWAPSCFDYTIAAFYVGVVPVVIFLSVGIRRALGGRVGPPPAERPEDRHAVRVPFLLTLFVFFFLYAAGRYTPVFGFCWRTIPLLQWFISPAKCLLCVMIALSCLSGIGMDYLARAADGAPAVEGRWRRYLIRWGALLTFIGLAVFIALCLVDGARLGKGILVRFFNLSPDAMDGVPWDVLLLDALKLPIVGLAAALLLKAYAFSPRHRALAAWLIVLISFADLWVTNTPLLQPAPADIVARPSDHLAKIQPPGTVSRFFLLESDYMIGAWQKGLSVFPKPKTFEVLAPPDLKGRQARGYELLFRYNRDMLYMCGNLLDRAYKVAWSKNFAPRDVCQVLRASAGPDVSPAIRARVLAMLNCDRIVVPPAAMPHAPLGAAETISLAVLDGTMPRAYVVGRMGVLPEHGHVIAALSLDRFDPWEVAFIDRASARGDDFADLRKGRVRHRIERLEYAGNDLTIEVESESAGMLVLSDSYYPGWAARLNGKAVPIYKVNGAFRGVRIPAGRSRVEMTYRPASLRIGAAVSLATLAIVLVLAMPGRLWRRPRDPRISSSLRNSEDADQDAQHERQGQPRTEAGCRRRDHDQ